MASRLTSYAPRYGIHTDAGALRARCLHASLNEFRSKCLSTLQRSKC